MFNTQTRKWIQSLILLLLGLYFLDNLLSGKIYYYINERFGWLSWIGTAIFLTLGVLGIYELLRERRAEQGHDHDHHDHDHSEHDHDHEDAHEHLLAHDHGHEGHNHG